MRDGSVTEPVWVGRAWEKDPHYHLWGRPDYSLCGLFLGDLDFGLRIDHAQKFATMCGHCRRAAGVSPQEPEA